MIVERAATADQQDRDIATFKLDKNIVVLAGAGTGKTTLLIDRLTSLIIGREIPIERIVAITFTKKAGEEIRERLEERLRLIQEGLFANPTFDEAFGQNRTNWAKLATKALDDIPKAQIGTIHSFASHLLRLFPLQAGVDPKFREDEGMIAESVFNQAWGRWMNTEFAKGSANETAWLPLLERLSVDEIRQIAFQLVNPFVEFSALKRPVELAPVVSKIEREFALLKKEYPLPTRAPAFLPALEALAAVLKFLSERKSVPLDLLELLDALKNPPTDWKPVKQKLIEIRNVTVTLALVDETLFKQLLELLMPLVDSVRRKLAQTGAVSFDGLLVFARNLVRDYKDVRETLKRRFATFLVDEFQDTDPLQGEILFFLAEAENGGAQRWQNVQLQPGRLFVVGDPKQSIYRFRGADIAAFEAFESQMKEQGALSATLSVNFRSDPVILDFVNTIFPTVMHEERFLQPAYAPLAPCNKTPTPSAVKVIRLAAENEKLSAADRRAMEANVIAEWVSEQVKNGVRYGDMALLLRSSYAFDSYLEAFRQHGIRYLAEGEKTFYRTSEVVDFLNLLSVVADPSDRLALVGVLRSPVGGMNDREIFELTKQNKLNVRHFATLRELAEEARVRPVGEMIREVLRRTWTKELVSTSAHGEQAVANLLKIGQLADAWNDQAPLTLKQFVQRFEKFRSEERDEGENPLADVTYDAVKVLTIHKAKGLEFPVVILPNLSAGERRGMDRDPIKRDWRTGLIGLRLADSGWTNAAMAVIEQQEDRREEAEEIRVFYVAATRAKSKLICFVDAQAKEPTRFAATVLAGQAVTGVLTEDLQKDKEPYRAFAPQKLDVSLKWIPSSLVNAFREREREFEILSQQRVFASPTLLLSEPEKLPFRLDDEDVALARDAAINLGHVCHKVLEEWDFGSQASSHKKALALGLLRAAKLLELDPALETNVKILEEANGILAPFFASEIYGRLSKSVIVGREVPFLYAASDRPFRAMRGFIDLLYEKDGQLIIADYKTNRLNERTEKSLIDHYRVQGRAYQEAVFRSLGRKAEFELIFLRGPKRFFV